MNWASEPAADATLKAAWIAGMSAERIADMIGHDVTPAAVRCRARVLDLPPRGALEAFWRGRYASKPAKARRTSKPLPKNVGKLGPLSDPKPWSEREFGDCAFPIEGEDGLLCCGGPIPPGARRPYCLHHLAATVTHAA